MKYLLFLIPVLLLQSVLAQSALPVIRATSKKVAINDDGVLDKNAWSLSPGTRPDVYTADRTRKTKWVTFYTDIDSIKVKVKPGMRYNFVVVLNGKDSCYTRIDSAIPPAGKPESTFHDTIPFTLTAFNAIAAKAVINNTDTLKLHFDLSSFDFHLTRDAISNKTKLLADRSAPDYNKLKKVFRLQVGNTVWANPAVLPTGFTAHDMDGRFGWNLFEGKTVEIDYDRSLIIVNAGLPKHMKGYIRSSIAFIRSYPCIKGTFEIAGKKYSGIFTMDTGSDQAVVLDSAWMNTQGFPQNLRLIRSLVISDPRGVKYNVRKVLSPRLKLNGFILDNVPSLLLTGSSPLGSGLNTLGNEVLKRFNMILDLKHDHIYLKPNHLMNSAFGSG